MSEPKRQGEDEEPIVYAEPGRLIVPAQNAEPPKPEPENLPDEETQRVEAELSSKAVFGTVRYGKPLFAEQLRNLPWTVRYGPLRMRVFHLPGDETTFDAVLDRTLPEGAPTIQITQCAPNFVPSTGHYSVLLTYREIDYIITKEPKQP